jgi:hypothetical protein
MQRFLMLVGVAVVAAAMYVAAGSASHQSRGPTARQFNALKKQVASMKKTLKKVENEGNYIKNCLKSTNAGALPVSEFGDAQTHAYGYQYYNGTTTSYTTALDIDAGPSPGGFLQIVDRACVGGAGSAHLQLRSGNGSLAARPTHSR